MSDFCTLPPDFEASKIDVIGDVHGCYQTLQRLLEKLGYQKSNGSYRHPTRKVIFVGDIVDRGPRIREALSLVREMVESRAGLLILGNHEVHAVCYCTAHPNAAGNYLRPHTPRNTQIISETLEQFANHPTDWQEHLQWLQKRPLYVQSPRLRVVHACWDQQVIARTTPELSINDWVALSDPNTAKAKDVKRLTSGIEIPLPEPHFMVTAEGFKRRSFRAGFWRDTPASLGELAFQPDPLPSAVAHLPIGEELRERLVVYDEQAPPLFVGHYWLTGAPAPITPNLACLDYSAVKFGRLVAYRCDGRAKLSRKNFQWVYVDP